MKKYVIDELESTDLSKLRDFLKNRLHSSGVDSIFWLFLTEDLLNDIQKEHTECHPYYFAVELTKTSLSCEMLIRSSQRLGCDCIVYADQRQREWAIGQMEAILKKLAILT